MKKYFKWVALALTVVWCIFIWQFSLSTGEQSTATSNKVVESVNQVLEKINPNLEVTSTEIRKSAHFVEFMGLGALLGLTLYLFGFPHVLPFGMIGVVPVAIVDECLQFLAPGRSPMVADVILDSAGYLCGCAVIWIFAYLRRKKIK